MRRTILNCLLLGLAACADSSMDRPAAAPEFTHQAPPDWVNSAPLKVSNLRGKVMLIEFWTFDCYNCRNTLPWLKAIHSQLAERGLTIVSVHTPELPQERDPKQVRAAIQALGIDWPVMLDTDFSYWRALDNRYWPAFYLVGRDGQIAATAIGELHKGDRRGDQFERRIRELLAAK
jgi:thiol-disulfide isomerase/thioredoxin